MHFSVRVYGICTVHGTRYCSRGPLSLCAKRWQRQETLPCPTSTVEVEVTKQVSVQLLVEAMNNVHAVLEEAYGAAPRNTLFM